MKHVPHVLVAAPWTGTSLRLSVMQWRHLTKVLRLRRGDQVSYSDGLGNAGEGQLESYEISRGDEHEVDRPSQIVIAVAPPGNKDRQRFLVEKLAELGVERLRWLRTAHGKERLASSQKLFAWSVAAVEQSRGAWLIEVDEEFTTWEELDPPIVVCHPGGSDDPVRARTVVIGPEGGLREEEIPAEAIRWDLGSTILRTETAAIVAASRLI